MTDTTTDMLTADRAEDLLRWAVEEYGDDYCDPNGALNEPCRNVYRDEDGDVTGHCIAAKVLSLWGVDNERLESAKGNIESVISQLELDVEPVAMMMLALAQQAQDLGASWRMARAMATRVKTTTRGSLLEVSKVE